MNTNFTYVVIAEYTEDGVSHNAVRGVFSTMLKARAAISQIETDDAARMPQYRIDYFVEVLALDEIHN